MTRRDANQSAGPLAAAIDVGTNTVLLLIGRLDENGELEIVDDRCETPRLGAGVAARGSLDPDSIQRTLDVLRGFVARIDELRVPRARVRAVGTAVFRRARDARDFIERVRTELDLALEVASEEEEARLSYQAVVGEGSDRATLVIDVGGGSTELVTDGGARRYSAPVGAVVLSETYLSCTPESRSDVGADRLRAAVRRAFEIFPAGAARAGATDGTRAPEVVALGGTSLNLAALVRGDDRFDHIRTEGTRVDATQVAHWSRQLLRMTPSELERLPIEHARRGILPAGIVCLDEALQRIEARELSLSGRGLRYGLVRELLSAGD